MQVNFRRNLSDGFRIIANYTWGHAIEDVVGFFKDYQNEFDAKAEIASSDQNTRHIFVLDIGYELPFRKVFAGGPQWLVDGWQLTSITQALTGFPRRNIWRIFVPSKYCPRSFNAMHKLQFTGLSI